MIPKPRRTASQYRLYSPETVDRLQFIGKAQSLGLRLSEIKEVLESHGLTLGMRIEGWPPVSLRREDELRTA